jgi:uncharacterized SAM-binding protein YcdF (DUF218 family)
MYKNVSFAELNRIMYCRLDEMNIIKDFFEIIFSPLGILALIMCTGIILSFIKRFRHTGQRFLIGAGILFLIFLFSPLAQYLMLSLEWQYPPLLNPPKNRKIERIVILAGYAEEIPEIPITSVISVQTIGTLSEGFRLYKQMPGAKLISSGGVVHKGDRPVAASMADFLHQMGAHAEDLIVEGNSRNTYENLVEVKKIVGPKPFILVAQACDLKRAVAVARKLQMQFIPAPACFWAVQHHRPGIGKEIADFFLRFAHPSVTNLSRIQWAYHEYAGMVWYRITGRI